MTGDKYSAGLVFCVGSFTELYCVKDYTLVVEEKTRRIDNVHGVVGFDMQHFYDTFLELYRKVLTLVI